MATIFAFSFAVKARATLIERLVNDRHAFNFTLSSGLRVVSDVVRRFRQCAFQIVAPPVGGMWPLDEVADIETIMGSVLVYDPADEVSLLQLMAWWDKGTRRGESAVLVGVMENDKLKKAHKAVIMKVT